MKFTKVVILFLSLLLVQTSYGQTNACSIISKQMFELYKNHKTFDKSYPWTNLDWLQKQIGLPQTKPLSTKIYYWGNYSVKVESAYPDLPIELGNRPDALKAMSPLTIDTITTALGKPDKVEEIKGTEYLWQCQENPSRIKISIMNFPDQNVFTYTGQYCVESSCASFISGRIEITP